MIDPFTEQILGLREAVARLPRRQRGKSMHVATIYRWATRGIRGVRLETIQIGGSRCTSVEALQRFFRSLSMRSDTSVQGNTPTRERQIMAAERELRDNGL